MAVGDIYQLVDEQDLQGSVVLNVYFYKTQITLTGNVAQQLCNAFEDNVLPSIVALQDSNLIHTSLRATNLYDASDTFTSLISEAGTAGGTDTMPSFAAAGFELVQDNGAIHNGSKRIGGVADAFQSNGVFTDVDFIAALVTAGVAMLGILPVGLSNAFVPVIVKRILDGGNYRLPANSGEEVYGTIVDALYNVDVTSQTSRKKGVGA